MPQSAKVAISLPEDLLEAVETARRTHGESRSQFFRRAAEALLASQREDELDRQYILAYQAMPETVDQGLYAAGLTTLALEPWEEGDHE